MSSLDSPDEARAARVGDDHVTDIVDSDDGEGDEGNTSQESQALFPSSEPQPQGDPCPLPLLAVHHTDPGADADVAVGAHPHQAT